MKPSKPVTIPRVTPLTASRLKQVVGGIRGAVTRPINGDSTQSGSGEG